MPLLVFTRDRVFHFGVVSNLAACEICTNSQTVRASRDGVCVGDAKSRLKVYIELDTPNRENFLPKPKVQGACRVLVTTMRGRN